eukprot:747845-Hanusia_phi.AAC.7
MIKAIEYNGSNSPVTIANTLMNIHGGSPYAISNNNMAAGSLTIGSIDKNYGGDNNWTTNTP